MKEICVLTNPTRLRNNLTRRARLASLTLQFLAAALALIPKQAALAAATPGVLVAWGEQALSYVEPGTRFTKLAAGGLHTLALKQSGTVASCGWNYYGQATVPGGLTNIVAITAGYLHSLALKADGTVVAWGRG
ncbi:MAG TPA: hypothetical protein VEO53_18430, partial [Candidatus Binatia bacterium]|nr:hypothetical protein [Candidatus Binatia bacterium]